MDKVKDMNERPLEKGLTKIKKIISDMADSALHTVEASTQAYIKGESVEVQVRAWSDALRSMDNDVEELAVELLARHQPMATNLRSIKSCMKISYDLSRFGRYAFDISYVLKLLDGYKMIEGKNQFIKEMCDKVLKMLQITVEIYKTQKFEKIDDLNRLETEVDEMYRSRLRSMAKEKPRDATKIIADTLFTRHLERIADHACYIVEEVYYMVYGRPMYIR